jgi:membrane protein DedA with SNARE-associated domain
MPFARFVAFDAVGCFVWAAVFILIGYASGVRLEALQQGFRMMSVAGQAVLTAGVAAWVITRVVALRSPRPARARR